MCKTRPVSHFEVFKFLIEGWIETESSDEDTVRLKELVVKEGIEKVYTYYLHSDEIMVTHDHITEIIGRLIR